MIPRAESEAAQEAVVWSRVSRLVRQFGRYVVVGGVAFVADVSTLVATKEFLGLGVLLAAGVGFAVGTVVNYVLSTRWVFNARVLKRREVEFIVFFGLGLVGATLNEGLMWLFAVVCSMNYLLAKGLVAGLVLGWNFLARRVILFRETT